MGDFFKKFEQAVENVASIAVENAASALDEFPDKGQDASAPVRSVNIAAGFEKGAAEYWIEANIEAKRNGWNDKRLEIEQAQRADRSAPPSAQALKIRLASSESLLLTVLDLLVEAPDPAPVLLEGRDTEAKAARLAKEVERLHGEAGEAVKESEGAKELRDKVRQLEGKLAEAEESLKAKAAELEEVIAEQAAINMKEIQERDQAQRAELEQARGRLRALQQTHEQTQNALFELKERSEEEQAAQAAEAELAAAEVEAARQRVAEVERLREQLNRQVGDLVEGGAEEDKDKGEGGAGGGRKDAPSGAALRSLEVMIAAKDHMIGQLKEQLGQTSTLLGRAQAEADNKVEEARGSLQRAEKKVHGLEREVERKREPSEVDALKKQVLALASMVDSRVDVKELLSDLSSEQKGPSASQGPEEPVSAVQRLLQERNTALADEVTSLRWRVSELEAAAGALGGDLGAARADAEEKGRLVVLLEEDLERALGGGGGGRALPGAASEAVAAAAGVGGEAQGPLQPGNSDDMLSIVIQQRDRFRGLLSKTDEELSVCKDSLTKAQSELQAVKADNVSLYEKIRYLESYSQQQVKRAVKQGSGTIKVDADGVPIASASLRYQCGPISMSVGDEDSDAELALGKAGSGGLTKRGTRYQCFSMNEDDESGEASYQREYEERLNPFSRFKHREASAGITNLPPSDRAVLAGGQLLAGSKMARIFVATYAALLHLFVFAMLYSSASR